MNSFAGDLLRHEWFGLPASRERFTSIKSAGIIGITENHLTRRDVCYRTQASCQQMSL